METDSRTMALSCSGATVRVRDTCCGGGGGEVTGARGRGQCGAGFRVRGRAVREGGALRTVLIEGVPGRGRAMELLVEGCLGGGTVLDGGAAELPFEGTGVVLEIVAQERP